jgi:hypothetical protein
LQGRIPAIHRAWIAAIPISILLTAAVQAANPFLDAPDDKPMSAQFRGTEWSDTISEEEIPLKARVVTTRLARMPWGGIYKIEFTDIKSRAPQPRELPPEYFVVTDNLIVLLNEKDMERAIRDISALDKAPRFNKQEVYGIAAGSLSCEDGLWKTTITLKGDLCIYETHHPSGHFKRIVWKKNVGLVEYSAGYGARADGYRLKRRASKTPRS